MKKRRGRLARASGTLIVAIWLALASFMVVLSPPVTHLLAETYVDTNSSQLSHDYLVQIADATRSYCVGLDVELPLGEDERVAYTPQIMQHLDDVRTVFIICQVAALAVTVLLILYIIFFCRTRKYGRSALTKPLLYGSLAVIILTLLLAVLGAMNFNTLFTAMHRIFFAEGSWLFSYDSLLICALPTEFWIGCALVWAVSLVACCVLAIVVSRLLNTARR